jgi:type II secretion system (T2SS) protein G
VTETARKPFNPTYAVIANVIVGGGLVLAALTLIVIRDMPLIRFLLFPCGFLSIGLTIVACAIASKRESRFVRRLAISAGVVAFASLNVWMLSEHFEMYRQIDWQPLLLLVLMSIGIAILLAGLAIWRGRLLGRSLQLALVSAPTAFYFYMWSVDGWGSLAVFGCFLLLIPSSFLAIGAEIRLQPFTIDYVVMADVAVGGGLVLGALALFLIRTLSPISYSKTMTAFRIVGVMAAVSIALTIIAWAMVATGRAATFSRKLAASTGVAGFALLTVQIGLFGGWSLVALIVLIGIGIVTLTAGLAIVQGKAWGRYLQLALAATPSAFFFTMAIIYGEFFLALFGFFLLIIPIAFLDPLMVLSDRRRDLRMLSRAAFVVGLVILLGGGVLMATSGADDLIHAFQRSRQKRSMADMRIIADAVDSYGTDHKSYPAARGITGLARLMEPAYVKSLPRNDAWGYPFDYARVILPTGEEGYVIRTAGADNLFEQKNPTAYTYVEGGVQGVERDLVMSTISPSQWPEGMMAP